MQFSIGLAESNDIASWMTLTEQVVPLFGPMPDFEAILQRKISRRQAFCARSDSDRAIAGGMLIGGTGSEFWIRWLAVSRDHRRCGIGRMLVKTAIANAPAKSIIYVDTFAERNFGAEAAASLYKNCGFEPAEIWRMDGAVRQRYVRKPVDPGTFG